MRAAIVAATGVDESWIMDFYDDYAVYERPDGRLYKVDYAVGPDEKITLGQPIAVTRDMSYRPVGAATEAAAQDAAFTETGELVEVES